jgi:two-component system nitrogen regulation response regulator NtrX
LRERADDIPSLVNEFIRESTLTMNLEPKEFSEEALEILKKYPWPGNVREIRNLVERLVIMTPGRLVQGKDIPAPFNQQSRMDEELSAILSSPSYKEAKGSFERAFLVRKLREFNGNISQTADAIGIERSNLHKKIKAYGLEDYRPQ